MMIFLSLLFPDLKRLYNNKHLVWIFGWIWMGAGWMVGWIDEYICMYEWMDGQRL